MDYDNKMIMDDIIIPKIMNYKNKIYDILTVDDSLIINRYDICLKRFKVVSIILYNNHPNCNPNTNEFCLPIYMKNQKIESIKNAIPLILSIYNIDNCYYSPWGLITYKKRDF